jgi:hypothetical protein
MERLLYLRNPAYAEKDAILHLKLHPISVSDCPNRLPQAKHRRMVGLLVLLCSLVVLNYSPFGELGSHGLLVPDTGVAWEADLHPEHPRHTSHSHPHTSDHIHDLACFLPYFFPLPASRVTHWCYWGPPPFPFQRIFRLDRPPQIG